MSGGKVLGPGANPLTDPVGYGIGKVSGGGGGGGDYQASNLLASIVQQQAANYKGIYNPIEDQLIKFATDPNSIANAQAQAGATADAASANAGVGLQKTLGGQGVSLTPPQQQSVNRKLGLQAALSKVGAMNNAGQQTYDTITSVLTGGQPNITGLTNPNNISQVV